MIEPLKFTSTKETLKEVRLMDKKTLVANLRLLAEKSFCHHTADRATVAFYKIKDYIPEKYQIPLYFLWQEVGNPDNDRETYHEACKYLKEYIEDVIKNIENNKLEDIQTNSYAVQYRLDDAQDRRSVTSFYPNGSQYLRL